MKRFSLCVAVLVVSVLTAFPQASAPELSVRYLGTGQVQVAWPSSFSGYTLESSETLLPDSWQPVSPPAIQGQQEFFATISAAQSRLFLRLTANAPVQLTTILASSPLDGETGVAVTRETIVTFSAPLASQTVLSSNTFFATFGGRRILSRLELSSDRRKASLFYLEPLPGSARILVSFNGGEVQDASGQAVDADDDGTPGGVAEFTFDTLSLSDLPGTAVVGTVYASEVKALTAQGTPVNQPLEGVTITVDGREQDLREVTDAQGKFVLSPVPPGRFFVKIDGRTARGSSYPNGAYYPYVGKAWEAIAGKTNNLAGGTGVIFLPLIAPGTLQTVSATADTTVTFPAAVTAENPALEGVSVTVPSNALFNDNGTRGGKVGIAPVAPDRLPGPLPPGAELPLVITVQTDGALNFDRPAPVCFPNLPNPTTGQPWPPGTKGSLISFNHKKGVWEDQGDMTVSADGRFFCTDPGVGIVQPGWHGVQSPKAAGPPPPPKPRCTRGEDKREGCEGNCLDEQEQCLDRANALMAIRASCDRLPGLSQDEIFRCEEQIYLAALHYRNQCLVDFEKCQTHCINCYGSGAPPPPGTTTSAPLRSAAATQEGRVNALINQAADILQPYVAGGVLLPANVREQTDALFAQADAEAGGDAAQFLQRIIGEKEQASIERAKAKGLDLLQLNIGNAPAWPILYAAVILRPSGRFTLRGQTEPFGQYSLFLPPDGQLLYVSFFDAKSRTYGITTPNYRPDAEYKLRRFNLAALPADAADFDHDGLADLLEEVIGTDSTNPDSDEDGIPDGAEIEQGTNPLDGFAVGTGVVANAKTPGAAIDIWTGTDVAVTAEGPSGISIFPTYDGSNAIMLSHLPLPGNAQRVSGFGTSLFVTTPDSGVFQIDISNQSSPSVLHKISIASARSVVVGGGVAYVGADSGSVSEISTLNGAVGASTTLPAAVQDLAIEGDRLYALTADKLYIFNTSDGLTLLGSVAAPVVLAGNQRLFVGGNIAYTVHRKGYDTIDVSDAAKPALLSAGNTTQFGWRQIVANGSGLGLACVGPNSTDDGRHDVSLYDLSDPKANNVVLTTFPIPGNARAVSIYNGLGYVAADKSGLEILNYLPYDNRKAPPTIKLKPAFGTDGVEEGKLTRVSAEVTDDVQVRNVEFYIDGEKKFTDGSFPFEFRLVAPIRTTGKTSFALRARAFDTGGNSTWSDDLLVKLLPDQTPPRVIKSYPLAGARTLNVVLATLNEPIDPATLNGSSFTLKAPGPDGELGTSDDLAIPAGSISFDNESRTAVFRTTQPLAIGRYQATLKTAVTDLAGNHLTADYSWRFQVADANFWLKSASGLWTDPLNWSSGEPPQPGENVIIDVPADVVVTISRVAAAPKTIFLNNQLSLSGATITGTMISRGPAGSLQFTGTQSTLDGVTVEGDVDLSSGGVVRVLNGLALTMGGVPGGNVKLGNGAQLGFEGDQSFGPATVEFVGTVPSYLGISGPTTLTLKDSVLIHGRTGIIGQALFNGNGTQALVNQGTIQSEVAGGTFTINPDQFTNEGMVSANAGTINISASVNWSNRGTLAAGAGAVFTLNGTWSNTGSIRADGGTLNLDYVDSGVLTLAKLGQLTRNGGTVNLACTLDNTGGTLALNAQTGPWALVGGGVKGGTLTQSEGAKLLFTGTRGDLNGVTIEGDLDLSGGGLVRVLNGLTLTTGGVPGGNVKLGNGAQLGFEGDQSFGPATVEFVGTVPSYLGISGPTTLTLKDNVLIHGRTGIIGQALFNGNGTQALVNQGTIQSEVAGGTFTINPDQFTNEGMVSANAGTINIPASVNWSNSGTLAVGAGAVFTLNGTWGNTGSIRADGGTLNLDYIDSGVLTLAKLGELIRNGGTVNLACTLDNTGGTLVLNAQTGPWALVGGAVKGGTLTQSEGAKLLFTGTRGDLNGVTIEGDLDLSSGGLVRVLNGLMLTTGGVPGGNVKLGNGAQLGFEGDQSFGPATVEFVGTVPSYLGISGPTTLTLKDNVLIQGRTGILGQPLFNGNGTQALVNQGTIQSDVAAGTFTINPDQFTNEGIVSANLGTINIPASVIWSNSGTVAVESGAALTLNGTWSNTGLIRTDGGTLNLDYADNGALTLAKLGQLTRNGGTVNLACTLDNTGGTLALNAQTGPWALVGGGVKGGKLTQSEGTKLLFTGTRGDLNGVTIEGDLDLSSGGLVRVLNGLMLTTGGVPGGNVKLGNGAQLGFEGDQSFGPATVEFVGTVPSYFGISGPTTLTLKTATFIHGRSGYVGQALFNANGTQKLINEGTITADVAGGTIRVNPDAFVNNGTAVSANGGNLILS